MDLQANPVLVCGEEFYFPATVTYYPTPYAPTGINVPAELYEHQRIWGCGDQGLHYSGQQAEAHHACIMLSLTMGLHILPMALAL